MRNPKRAWLLAGSGLTALALVAGAAFIHTRGAAAATSSDNSTITYIAKPPMKFMAAASAVSPNFPTPSQCIANYGLACYTPAEIRKAYNIPASATGAGQTIVIVDAYGSPTIQSDLQTFDATFGLPDPTLNIYYPTGKNIDTNAHKDIAADWAGETSLDVEWSHAIAPLATIDLVIASNDHGDVLNNAVRYAIDNHLGNVISMSYGLPENAIHGGANNAQEAQSHANFVAAQAAGITVFSSSGDSGATDGTASVTANYPASDPLVTSVGGTNLFIADNGAYQSENVWNDADACAFGCSDGAFGATGGAPSALYGATSFQTSRSTSDVAYNASVYTAVMVAMNGNFYFFGGTSEGSPQWAGIVADADQAAEHSLGYLNPKLYQIAADPTKYAADFHDVTSGDNGFFGPGFSAGTGYDIPTGLGSPNVANLIPDLIG